MRLLLYCDEYCYKYNGRFFLEHFGIILLNRYLSVFKEIKYVVRVKEVDFEEELGPFNESIDESHVEVVSLPYGQGAIDFLSNFYKIQHSLKDVFEGCQISILRLPSIYSFNVLWYVWKSKLPYATEIVFSCFDGYKSSTVFIDKISWLMMHLLQQRACFKAEGVSCVTERYLQRLYFPKKNDAIVSNYSSIELPRSFYLHSRVYPRIKQFKIIHVAYQVAFNSRKGHNQLLEALKIVKQNGLDAEIIFVGGDYKDGIKRLNECAKALGVENYISFTGFVNQLKLREIMTQVDLAVLPTKAEGLPRVVIEAMAMGLPCISTNVSGNPELLDKEFLIEYSDVEGLAKCIHSILSNKDVYEYTSRINFERSLQFEAKTLQAKRESFYKALKNKIEKKS